MRKNLIGLIVASIIFAALTNISGCASKGKYTPPNRANQNLSNWDHDKIRQVRETESAMTMSEVPAPEDDAKNCVVMTLEEMNRAKVTGCKPLDPRAGHGTNAYCCPSKED